MIKPKKIEKQGIERIVDLLSAKFTETALSHNPDAGNNFNLEHRLKFNAGEIFEKNGEKLGLEPAAMGEAIEAATSIIPEYLSIVNKLKQKKEMYSIRGFWQSLGFGFGLTTGGSISWVIYNYAVGLPIPHFQHPYFAISTTLIAGVLLSAAYRLYDASRRYSPDDFLNGLPRQARPAYSAAVNMLFYRVIHSYNAALHSIARS